MTIDWGHSALRVVIEIGERSSPSITAITDKPSTALWRTGPVPLVEIIESTRGREWSGYRSSQTALGASLRYESHDASTDGEWHRLSVHLVTEDASVRARVDLRSADGVSAIQSRVTLTNLSGTPLHLASMTSLALGIHATDASGMHLHWAQNEWLAEARWTSERVRALLPDIGIAMHGYPPRGCFAVGGTGTWPTGRHLPMGALVDEAADMALAWQAESGGSWSWEFGEREDGFYLAVLGPTEMRDQWQTELREGESFTTIPASLAVTRGGFERAVGVLTRHRRALFDGSAADERRPVVYNDYMNTLMGDPTTEKLLPLIESASAVGAEYFCIDAGWYDETGSDWWATVGDWVPSTTRFPGGIGEVFDAIRGRGMVPGLWLEPEAAGIRSDVARQLPDEAFFQRAGGRAVEQSRHMLDFSHPAVTERMDRVVDGLIGTYGLGYLKLDQNINMSWISGEGPGPGQAILNHARAYRAWLAALSARHPTVILENCASGGLRMDYSLLSVAHIQSMSDQQDYARLAAIAASAPTAVLPEQAAIWAYAQPDHSLDEIGFIMTSALLGRMHLSGRLNEMSASQLQQVSSAVATHKQLRDQLSTALSFWPLGVPRWEDDWLSLGMQSDGRRYLAIWRRSGITSECELPLPGAVSVRLAYPATEATSATWRLAGERLLVSLPSAPSSVLLEVLGERDGRDLEGASYV